MEPQPTKRCSRCGAVKPLSDFHRSKKRKFGVRSACKTCVTLDGGHALKDPYKGPLTTKHCKDCGREFPATLEYFHKHESGRFGLKARCKSCQCICEKHKRVCYKDRYRRYWLNRNRVQRNTADRRRWHAIPKIDRKRFRVKVAIKRAHDHGAKGTYSPDDIARQYSKQGGRCYWCGNQLNNAYHIDHVIPISRGGTNWPANLVCACQFCNLSKGNKLPYTEWTPSNPIV